MWPVACMVKSVQRRASLGREEGGEHPSLDPTKGMGSRAGPPLQYPHSRSHLQPPSQHSLHQLLGPVAAQVVGHAVGAVERGFDIEAAQVPRVGLVEVEGDAGDIDPPRGLARQAQLVAGRLGENRTRVTQWYPHPSYPTSPSISGTGKRASHHLPTDPSVGCRWDKPGSCSPRGALTLEAAQVCPLLRAISTVPSSSVRKKASVSTTVPSSSSTSETGPGASRAL